MEPCITSCPPSVTGPKDMGTTGEQVLTTPPASPMAAKLSPRNATLVPMLDRAPNTSANDPRDVLNLAERGVTSAHLLFHLLDAV